MTSRGRKTGLLGLIGLLLLLGVVFLISLQDDEPSAPSLGADKSTLTADLPSPEKESKPTRDQRRKQKSTPTKLEPEAKEPAAAEVKDKFAGKRFNLTFNFDWSNLGRSGARPALYINDFSPTAITTLREALNKIDAFDLYGDFEYESEELGAPRQRINFMAQARGKTTHTIKVTGAHWIMLDARLTFASQSHFANNLEITHGGKEVPHFPLLDNHRIVQVTKHTTILFRARRAAEISGQVSFDGEVIPHQRYSIYFRDKNKRRTMNEEGTTLEYATRRLSSIRHNQRKANETYFKSFVPSNQTIELLVLYHPPWRTSRFNARHQRDFKSSLPLSDGVYYSFKVSPLTEGETRRNLKLEIPPAPHIRIELPEHEVLISSGWGLHVSFEEDPERHFDPKGKHPANIFHKPGQPTQVSVPLDLEMIAAVHNVEEEATSQLPEIRFEDTSLAGYDDMLRFLNKRKPTTTVSVLFHGTGTHSAQKSLSRLIPATTHLIKAPEVFQIAPSIEAYKHELALVAYKSGAPVADGTIYITRLAPIVRGEGPWSLTLKTKEDGLATCFLPHGRYSIIANGDDPKSQGQGEELTVDYRGPARVRSEIVMMLRCSLNVELWSNGQEVIAKRDQAKSVMLLNESESLHSRQQLGALPPETNTAHFRDVSVGQMRLIVFFEGYSPLSQMIEVEKSTQDIKVELQALQSEETLVDLSSLQQPAGACIIFQGDFQESATLIGQTIVGVGKFAFGESLGIKRHSLVAYTFDQIFSLELDPNLPSWLGTASGAIIRLTKQGATLKPDPKGLTSPTIIFTGKELSSSALVVLSAYEDEPKKVGTRKQLTWRYLAERQEDGSYWLPPIEPGTYRITIGDASKRFSIDPKSFVTINASGKQTFHLTLR